MIRGAYLIYATLEQPCMKCEALFTRMPMEGPPNPICWMCNNAFIDVLALLNVPQTWIKRQYLSPLPMQIVPYLGPRQLALELSFTPKDVVPLPVAWR